MDPDNIDVFTCFHGTTQENANKIKRDKSFIVKSRNNHWLGNGVYFYIRDYEQARWWSFNTIKLAERHGESNLNPQVIQLKARISTDLLLDLDSETDRQKLECLWEIITYYSSNLNFIGIEDKKCESNRHVFTCSLIDTFIEFKGYQAVKYTFKGHQIGYSDFTDNSGIECHGQQLSIFDQSVIDFSTYKEMIN